MSVYFQQTYISETPILNCIGCPTILQGNYTGYSLPNEWLSTDPYSMLSLLEWYDLVGEPTKGELIALNESPRMYLCWECLVQRVEKIREILK